MWAHQGVARVGLQDRGSCVGATRVVVFVVMTEPVTEEPTVKRASEAVVLESPPPPSVAPASEHGLVLKNTLFLMVAQIIGMPLSVVVNAVMGRRLGPVEFGYLYLAQTFTAFGFIVIEWGQSGTIPAMVARDRRRAGEFVGSGLAFRGVALIVVYPIIALACRLAGYGAALQGALALIFASSAILSLTSSGTDAVLGFERTDIRAYALVGQQIAMAATILPTLLLGGHLRATLMASVAGAVLTSIFVGRSVLGTGLRGFRIRKATLKRQFDDGVGFMALGLILALQPAVDAILLGRLGTVEAVGWNAAARKLIGVIVFPAVALSSALYPTLCRLFTDDLAAYALTVSAALRTATVLVVPLALGVALYADIGVQIFSTTTFGPAENNLRVLSLFVFLVYFSMTLGVSLNAAGKQRAWAITQFGCVAVSAIADPVLIPWFQTRTGNGGLGVCVSTVLSEILMVSVGLWLFPTRVISKDLVRGVLLAILAGGAMAATARLLSGITPYVAAPIAVGVYFGCMVVTGGLDKEQVQSVRDLLAARFRRFRRT